MSDSAARRDLEQAAGKPVESGVPLSRMTTVGCGGPAAFVATAESASQLMQILDAARRHGLPWFVIGQGSNLLVADAGWKGLVLKLTGELKLCRRERNALDCGGGASLPRAARTAYEEGLAGLEQLEGIPGTVGGAVALNAGAFGMAIGDRVTQVELCLPGATKTLLAAELRFSYRHSNLPESAVVSRVLLALDPGDREEIRAAMRRYLRLREERQPRGVRTFGSVFKNQTGGAAAGELLDRAGCKGLSHGAASVSSMHANFIINQGGAKASDIIWLMNECRRRVFREAGVLLEPEVKLLGDISLEPF